jgi:tripartite-type tricarboxylate transporter receptor subunit TctC
VTRVNTALTEAMREPAVVEKLKGLGFEPVAGTPEEFSRFIVDDVKRNAALLASIKFQPQ